MRFDNFPIELKRKIMSYLSYAELCEKVVPVSKEWELLATDSLNRKEIEFYENVQCFCCVEDILRQSRPGKITFNDYKFESVTLPIVNSVRELILRDRQFPKIEAIQMLVKSFPNTRQLTIGRPFEFMDSSFFPFYWDVVFMQGLQHGLEHLQQLKNLQSITLLALHHSIYNEIVVGIVKLDIQLKELRLLSSEEINDSTLKAIIEYQGQHLREFTMWFDSISTTSYLELINCRNLKVLSLLYPDELTDKEFVVIIQELKQLSTLRIEHSEQLFSKEFVQLFKNVTLSQLVSLFIGLCPQFNNKDLKSIVKRSPLLKSLELKNLTKITNTGLESVCKHGRNLKKLHLGALGDITKECVTKIAQELPNLCELVTFDSPLVSNERKHCMIYNRFLFKNIP